MYISVSLVYVDVTYTLCRSEKCTYLLLLISKIFFQDPYIFVLKYANYSAREKSFTVSNIVSNIDTKLETLNLRFPPIRHVISYSVQLLFRVITKSYESRSREAASGYWKEILHSSNLFGTS